MVCTLKQHNNRIEFKDLLEKRFMCADVAKWLGHRTLDVTFGTYWDVGGQDITQNMTIPWL